MSEVDQSAHPVIPEAEAPEVAAAPPAGYADLAALLAYRTDVRVVDGKLQHTLSGGSAELGTYWSETVEVPLDESDLDGSLQALNEAQHAAQMAHQAGA